MALEIKMGQRGPSIPYGFRDFSHFNLFIHKKIPTKQAFVGIFYIKWNAWFSPYSFIYAF